MYKRIGGYAAVAAPVRNSTAPIRGFAASGVVVPGPIVRPARWERRYEASVLCCDLLCLALANLIVAVEYQPSETVAEGQRATVLVICTVVAVLSIAFQKCWDRRILGSGPEEYRRIVRGYLYAIAASAVLAYLLGAAQYGVYIFGALPLALVLTLATRKMVRIIVLRIRSRGGWLRSVLVVGNVEEVHELVGRTNGPEISGWKVEGVCLAVDTEEGACLAPPVAIDDVPVLGTDADILRIAEIHKFDAVALLPSDRCSCARMRTLDRDLEAVGVDLIVAPILIDAVGPRLRISPLAGLPLLQVSAPRCSGPTRVAKNIADRVFALLLVIVLAPVLALAVYVFRGDLGTGRIGRFLRRHSIDELPELSESNRARELFEYVQLSWHEGW